MCPQKTATKILVDNLHCTHCDVPLYVFQEQNQHQQQQQRRHQPDHHDHHDHHHPAFSLLLLSPAAFVGRRVRRCSPPHSSGLPP